MDEKDDRREMIDEMGCLGSLFNSSFYWTCFLHYGMVMASRVDKTAKKGDY